MRIGGEFLHPSLVLWFCSNNSSRYAWCLTYFMNTHRDVCIVLKKSLKWVPIVGWVRKTCSLVYWRRGRASFGINTIERDQLNVNSTGHAILQLYLLGAFVGVRQAVPCEPPRLAR